MMLEKHPLRLVEKALSTQTQLLCTENPSRLVGTPSIMGSAPAQAQQKKKIATRGWSNKWLSLERRKPQMRCMCRTLNVGPVQSQCHTSTFKVKWTEVPV